MPLQNSNNSDDPTTSGSVPAESFSETTIDLSDSENSQDLINEGKSFLNYAYKWEVKSMFSSGKRFEMFLKCSWNIPEVFYWHFVPVIHSCSVKKHHCNLGKTISKKLTVFLAAVNDLAMLYYTERLPEKSLRRFMGLFKTYTDYKLPKDPRTIIARATENRKFAVETNNFLYIDVEEALSRVETMCGPFDSSLDNFLSTDDLPISSSSKKKFWPVLLSTVQQPEVVSVVAVFFMR